ncbi:phenoloxidase-activating factor 2-like [Macrosteles quadrilineatus]|uniref:phenoloxidase-activating factor 2-like n=1 Tax=Macrosteles quadrilineatus TaxID=74068 RepID=UPI0023E1F007|nr:phenoloxidase-activating factor 2-like [Macrosteles quadrilineatus]
MAEIEFYSEELVVRVGDWDVQSEREPLPYQDTRVTTVRVHPQYDRSTLANDIAVLTLAQGLRLYPDVPHVNSICLPLPTTEFTEEWCWVSGWGKDAWGMVGRFQSVQKAVDVGVVSGAECEARLRHTRLGRHYKLDDHSFLCAGGEKNKDACTGDGGAPLVCEGPVGHWTLAGLVAWGVGCAQPNIPGVYVNIPSMVPWIVQTVQSLRSNASALSFLL